MNILIFWIPNILAFIIAAILMEFVAMLTHRFVMHKLGWILHHDHHNTSGHRFQKNDLYALFFASISFILIFSGLSHDISYLASAGFGVALYGLGYVIFHEIMYHGRIRSLKFKPKSPYLLRILNAHRIHHATVTRDGAVSFHFLWAPAHYSPKNQQTVDLMLKEIRDQQIKIRKAQG